MQRNLIDHKNKCVDLMAKDKIRFNLKYLDVKLLNQSVQNLEKKNDKEKKMLIENTEATF